jgi:hypothetical protein
MGGVLVCCASGFLLQSLPHGWFCWRFWFPSAIATASLGLLALVVPSAIATAGSGLLMLVVSCCNRYRGFSLGLYFLFLLTPVRGGTYFLCCAKESKQRKALHTTSA